MSSIWHHYDVYRPSCDVGLHRSCVHGVIKCFVESIFFVILKCQFVCICTRCYVVSNVSDFV